MKKTPLANTWGVFCYTIEEMKSHSKTRHSGFALIGLLLTIVIVAVLAALYYRKPDANTPSPQETGQKAIEDAKLNNARQLEHQMEIQNQLNN